MIDRYTVIKHSGTHSDALTAIGAADLLRHVDPRIYDLGDRFEVRLARPSRPQDLKAVDPGFAYLVRPKREMPAAPPERIVRAGASYTTATGDRMYAILNRMRAYGGPNQVVTTYAQMKRAQWESSVWECLEGREDFVFRSPLVQLFDPHAARGYAMLKPQGTDRSDRTKDRWAKPFEQWLRYRGYFQGCAGWFADGDLRLFTPAPYDISLERLTKVAEAFREQRLGGSGIKMDCRAVLGFTRLLIESCRRKRRPREMASGLWVARYKDMGQVLTVTGMDFLALPNWMDLHADEHVPRWLAMIEEHDTAIRRLTDSHSEELAVLEQYRRTFQLNRQEAVGAFVQFLASYGPLVFRRRSQNHWTLPQFSLQSVMEIFDASPECRVALDNSGFEAVAAALRSATFGAQGRRRQGDPTHREVRNGLLAEIQRAGDLGKQDLQELVSTFIAAFNTESFRRRLAGFPASAISAVELDGFVRAVEHAPSSEFAAGLLCAVASCHRGETRATELEADMVRTAMSAGT